MSNSDANARLLREDEQNDGQLIHVVWEVTLGCNLSCGHCGSRAGTPREHELTTDQCLDVVAQFAAIGVRYVTLIGGEAFLRADWIDIIRAIHDAGMFCGMTTGGFELSKTMLDDAAAAGLGNVSVSIDGIGKTHDAQRGQKGAFEHAVQAAKWVREVGIGLAVNTQINRLSAPELSQIADLLVELRVQSWQVQLTVPMGNAADRPELILQPYDLLEVFPELVSIKTTKLDPAKIQIAPASNVGYFGPYERHLRFGGESGAHWSGCPAGRFTAGLESDGTLKGCPSLSTKDFAAGNVATTPVADVMQTPEFNALQGRGVDDLWGFCKTCYYAQICKAGCSWTAHAVLGRPGNNPFCIHRAETLAAEGKREVLKHKARAPGQPFDTGLFELLVEPLPDQAPSLLEHLSGAKEFSRILKPLSRNT